MGRILYCEYVFFLLYFDFTQGAWVNQCIALYLQKATKKNTKDGNTAIVSSVWELQESNDHSYGQ